MENNSKALSPFSIAFLLIGALFGAAFASGQEILKFFGAYGSLGKIGLAVCFVLYMAFGFMAFELSRIRNSDNMEVVVAPVENIIIKKVISAVMMFCFAVILIALFAAGDALFATQLGFHKGIGGLIIAIFVIITNIVGFDGIKKIMPIVVPVMLVIMLALSIAIIAATDHVSIQNPGKFMSPLAPNWFIGALLYVSYNFIAAVPVLSTLNKVGCDRKSAVKGMLIGFSATCVFGFLLYCALMTDIDVAGTYDIPMAYLSGKLSSALAVVYSLIMIIAIYSASSNCMYGLTKGIDKTKKKKRISTIVIIGLFAYFISLVGFSQLVTYAYPVQGYACIIIMICVLITYLKFRKKDVKNLPANTDIEDN